MAHSPGPWRWYGTDAGAVVGPEDGAWHVENISEDDARLIAAAPELLKALKDALGAATTWPDPHPFRGWEWVQALIARAEGK
jgi:hypothetical protein